MKAFAVYTTLRAVILAAVFGVLWLLLGQHLTVLMIMLLALVVSAIISIFALRGPRDALAGSIADRATRVQHRMRTAETPDEMPDEAPGKMSEEPSGNNGPRRRPPAPQN